MLEMASLGRKSVANCSVEFAGKIPSTTTCFYPVLMKTPMVKFDDDFKKNIGTLITTDEGDSMEQPSLISWASPLTVTKLKFYFSSA